MCSCSLQEPFQEESYTCFTNLPTSTQTEDRFTRCESLMSKPKPEGQDGCAFSLYGFYRGGRRTHGLCYADPILKCRRHAGNSGSNGVVSVVRSMQNSKCSVHMWAAIPLRHGGSHGAQCFLTTRSRCQISQIATIWYTFYNIRNGTFIFLVWNHE